MNQECLIPQYYSLRRAEYHREFAGLITQAQFGGAGCTLPYLVNACNFNKRCKRNVERRDRQEVFKLFKSMKKRTQRKKPGVTYLVKIDDIKIQESFSKTNIRPQKYENKKDYYLRTGEFESMVFLTQDNVLIDGYSTYLLAQEFRIREIPVTYVY